MTSPEANDDQQKLQRLASAVMDGTASEAEQQEITALLHASAEARDEYLALVDLHAILATELAGPSATQPLKQPNGAEPPRGSDRPSRRGWLIAAGVAALAACLLVAAIRFVASEPELVPGAPFTSVVQVAKAKWAAGASVKVGDRFGQKTMYLKSGFVRLEYDSGVEVTLQGPAELELLSPSRMKMKSGLLTATVPPGAEGFTVDTPTAEVVDLGTSFGIDLREDGVSSVSVFDGEVEVAVPHATETQATEKRLLTEGESVRIGANQEIEEISFDPQPFEKMWPISSGIAGSTDVFRFVPPWPKRIRFVTSDNDIFVATEGYAVHLSESLQVNISEPGKYVRVGDLTPLKLPAGARVRSYILHFSPTENLGPRRAKRVSGSITFDRPVLGLIVRHEELLASMRRFARRGAGEVQHRRQLDLTGGFNGDRVTLSADRKTITLDVISPGRNTDLVRVIVDGNHRR